MTPAPPADCLPDAAPAADNAAPLAQAIAIGIGCRQGVSVAQIEAAVQAALGAWPLANVRAVATLDAKTAEPALRAFCAAHGLPLRGFTREQVQATARQAASASDSMADSAPSAAALARFGVPGVCEPCARLAADGGALLRGKLALDGVTVALAAIAPDTRR
ncbi:cobalt-precorrin 5A hydrolase [Paraburkholderia tropica]|nr:cobalt-precorrin 5A hydrolase [Paraburkholderia tropica]